MKLSTKRKQKQLYLAALSLMKQAHFKVEMALPLRIKNVWQRSEKRWIIEEGLSTL